jgi:hypothetical protein
MHINEEEFLSELRAYVARKYVTRTAAAKAWEVSVPFACAVVNGDKSPNQTILDDVGYIRTKTVGYQKQGGNDE